MSSRDYFEKLKSPKWQKVRLRIMERDGFTCHDCASGSKSLQVHHCLYEKGDPWDTGEEFLITVCEECHKRRQKVESSVKRTIGKIFAELRSDPGFECSHLDGFASELNALVKKWSLIQHRKDYEISVVGNLINADDDHMSCDAEHIAKCFEAGLTIDQAVASEIMRLHPDNSK